MKKGLVIAILMVLIAALAAPVYAAEEVTVTGKLEITGSGMIMTAEDGEYAVYGDAVKKDMVGKNIKVTGMVTEADGKKNIEVTTAKVIE